MPIRSLGSSSPAREQAAPSPQTPSSQQYRAHRPSKHPRPGAQAIWPSPQGAQRPASLGGAKQEKPRGDRSQAWPAGQGIPVTGSHSRAPDGSMQAPEGASGGAPQATSPALMPPNAESRSSRTAWQMPRPVGGWSTHGPPPQSSSPQQYRVQRPRPPLHE